jgi:hypothetical protein
VSDKAREAVERAAEGIHYAREAHDPTGWDPDVGSDGEGGVPGAAYVAPWEDLGEADRSDYHEEARAALSASGLPEQVERLEAMRNQDAARHRECALNHIDKAQARRAYTEEMAKRKDAEAQLQEAREALDEVETFVSGSLAWTGAHARVLSEKLQALRSALGVLYEKGDGDG